jgi:hypothetical protein
MKHNELNELNTLIEGMTVGELMDKLSADTLTAVRSDLIAAQPLTTEEQAYFDAEHDLTCAIQKAADAARVALDSQDSYDLHKTSRYFDAASVRAKLLADAQARMQSAFRVTDEYAAQVEAQL